MKWRRDRPPHRARVRQKQPPAVIRTWDGREVRRIGAVWAWDCTDANTTPHTIGRTGFPTQAAALADAIDHLRTTHHMNERATP